MWHDGGHSLCECESGCGWAPVRGFCFGAKPTQGAWRKISYETGRRRGKARSQGSQQIGVSDSQGKARVRERWLLKWGVGICEPKSQVNQRERMSQRSWLLCGNFVRVHACDSHWCTEYQKRVKTFPFLRLGLTQVRACLSFFLPLSVIYIIYDSAI